MVTASPLNRPKILHLGKYSYHADEAGGVEAFLKSYTEYLKDNYNQTVVLFDSTIKKRKTTQEKGITIILFPVHFIAGYAPVNLFTPFYLHEIIASFSPDIIHVHMPSLLPFFCLWRLIKRKTIIHWHADVAGTKVSKTLAFPLYKIMEKLLLTIADSIVVTSRHYRDTSQSLKPFKKKCAIIPIGIDPTPREALSDGTLSEPIRDFIHDKRLVLSIGRLSYYKGYAYLIQAIALLQQEDVVLVIGGQGPEMKSLERIIQKHHLRNKVLLPGKISENDKKILLSRAVIFCLPSIDRAEAFGLSLVEAMKNNLPLLTTHVKGSGMNHVNIHNQTGIQVAPRDPSALAEALDTLLNGPDLAKVFGKQAHQRFLDHFQLPKIAEQLNRHYQHLL